MEKIIFKPRYSIKLWISFFIPVILCIISLITCIEDRFTDKSNIFDFIILSISSFVLLYFFYRNIAFRSIIFSIDTVKFERFFFKSVIKNNNDFEHVRQGVISFGNLDIMLLELKNANEIIKIVDDKIKANEFIEKPRTKKSISLQELGYKSVPIFLACYLSAMIIPSLMPWHLIDTQSDTLIIFVLLFSVILIPLIIRANKK